MLRDYQERAIADLRQAYAQGHRAPCLVLPCGGGKTLVAAEIIRSATARSKRTLFLAGRVELLSQTLSKLTLAGITDVRLIQAENDEGSRDAAVTVASVPTLASKRWASMLPPADLVIIDEAHHVSAASWTRLAAAYARSHLLGLTATPARSDGRSLGDIFDDLVIGATVQDLTSQKYLVPARVYSARETTSSRDLALSPIEAYEQHCTGQRTMVFCTTVSHAETVAAEFSLFGVRASVVHGKLGDSDRKERLDSFRAGSVDVLCNVGILVEGFDDPATSAAILARRFGHAGTFIQVCGRVLRPAPGKSSATIVDLCGSVLEHGTPDAARDYSLDGKGIRTNDRKSIRQCPRCGGVFVAGPVTCPMCEMQLPTQQRVTPRSRDTGVVEIAPQTPARPWFVLMTAKFRSICKACEKPIGAGAEIALAKGVKPIHRTCAPPDARMKRVGVRSAA